MQTALIQCGNNSVNMGENRRHRREVERYKRKERNLKLWHGKQPYTSKEEKMIMLAICIRGRLEKIMNGEGEFGRILISLN